jgi:hypothetical protein
MSFIVSGLPAETFAPLFSLDDEALAERNIVRQTALAGFRYPCRISLENALPGQTVLLLNYEHMSLPTPYRSNYAIFVGEAAREARPAPGELPTVLRGQPISLRVFDEDGMLLVGELALTDNVAEVVERQFERPEVAFLHAHNAAYGCYLARIDRA